MTCQRELTGLLETINSVSSNNYDGWFAFQSDSPPPHTTIFKVIMVGLQAALSLLSAQLRVVWVEPPGRWCAVITTSQWTSLSVIQTRGPPQSRSVPPCPVPPSTTASGSTTSPTDTLRTQASTPATAAGTCPQQTTSGGQDPGAQYVQNITFKKIVSREISEFTM